MSGASLTLGFSFRIWRVSLSIGWTGLVIGCGCGLVFEELLVGALGVGWSRSGSTGGIAAGWSMQRSRVLRWRSICWFDGSAA
ncbi:hypothetical protein FRAAL0463 [Frankia alni ACN14a]|uniref:Uncharacterized protein n=1 Tax=Frankia alni (strain DSM 45986 / CECT 9034 / ACN14a) TaxID=326424 RepID=Q0RTG1_FRAAA|nr:hypothetical protein FRAAL0463 [Frankia alni ACN14a]